MITFGQRLKELREKRRISQEELGKRFNLSQSTIAYYEKNKKQPSQNTLNKMADFFEVTTDYLIGRSDERSSNGITTTLEESEFLKKLRAIAAERGMELTDPKFLKLLDAALDFSNRIRESE